MIVAQGLLMDGLQVDISNKTSRVDHKDFDTQYQMNKKRNESKLTHELKNLREARLGLREFEANMDNDLPSLKKLKQFQTTARNSIDNSSRFMQGSLNSRNAEQEETLNDKIRELQRQNPDIDYTQLFDTERAEAARKAQHKRAFASYKAFQFLKHGVELQSRDATKKQEKPPAYQTLDPYEFKPVQNAVNLFTKTKERFPRVLDSGDALDQRPGRKFEYTE